MNEKLSRAVSSTVLNWLMLSVIIVFGGSSFVMIRKAVETIPPLTIAAGRLWVGAIFLYILMLIIGEKLPPVTLKEKPDRRLNPVWGSMAAIAVTGNVLPFILFPWAQQYIDSALAGIYMAFMPVWTLILAYFFAQESITRGKGVGFILGLIGVVILMGPDALKGAFDSDLLAQSGLLFATFLYATAVIFTRRAAPASPVAFTAGVLILSALFVTPFVWLTEVSPQNWELASLLSVLGLGLLPTGLNGIVIFMLVRRASASFMALSNYFTPLWALAMGAIFFRERLETNALIALAFILAGVFISQRKNTSEDP